VAEYVPIEQAKAMKGLRVVLAGGIPGPPWTESAKAVLHVKEIPYARVGQMPGQTDEALRAWTGHVNAPIAVYDDERPRAGWAEILLLAERLAPEPRLVPADAAERAHLLGLCHELMGEGGFGWTRRLLMLRDIRHAEAGGGILAGFEKLRAAKYGYSDQEAAAAPARIAAILRMLSERLAAQRARGSRYLFGDALTALDLYWAAMAALLQPLPHDQCPMPDWLRASYETRYPGIHDVLDPGLLAHREFVYREHLELPIDA
jgi:glutathione S-transferase